MNVLLDECVPLAWISFLQRHGHSPHHWLVVGVSGAGDDDVATWASRHGHAVLTCDTDFGQSLWFSQAGEPTTIQLGSPSWLPDAYGAAVVTALRECESRRPEHFFVRIATTGGRFKLIGLPLR